MSFITKTIGSGFQSNPKEVITLRHVLNSIGYKDPNLGFEMIDKNLDKNIKKFQKENNLKVDGVVTPNGETKERLHEIAVRSPTTRCQECGTPNGGVSGDLCWDCAHK